MLRIKKRGSKMYLYKVIKERGEDELFELEIKALFNLRLDKKYFFYDSYVDVNRSIFVKGCIDIKVSATTVEGLIKKVEDEKFSFTDFKVKYIQIEGHMDFNEKHRVEGEVGYRIKGIVDVHDPKIILGVTYLDGMWYMGKYIKNDRLWITENNRPRQYSNALPTRLSRSIVNLAVGSNLNMKVVDPCCGIGTVVIAGLSMGLDIRGYDINPKVVEGARINLKYFEYPNVIDEGDIKDLKEHYDAAIIDIPYGILSITTNEAQREIIKSVRGITNRLVFVSLDEMDEELISGGFNIIDKCHVFKGDFKRYITVCI